jgi:photosystem II stability/assembly factor-like uncharacterized protein
LATQNENRVSRRTGIPVPQLQEIKRRRSVDDAMLAEMPEELLSRLTYRLRLPDLPLARQEYLALRHRDRFGRLPSPEVMARNHQQALDMVRAAASYSPSPLGGAAMAGGVVPTWVANGPGNIGGRTRSLVPHPKTPHLVYAGSVGGGVWRSIDDGASWQVMDDRMVNMAICCMAIAPDGALFAGTGEGFGNIDALRGNGIFVSPVGAAWYQLASTMTNDFQYVNRLAITPNQVILAATTTGIMRSTNNGDSWTKTQSGGFTDAKAHPTNPMRAVAGTRDGKAYFTTDAGISWTRCQPTPSWGNGRIEIAYATADPNIVYAGVNNNNGEIWCSTDGGQTFSKRATLNGGQPANYLGAQGWYDNVIWAGMPNDANFVLVGGIDLWRSTDGGNSLNRISVWSNPASVHADHHVIAPAYGFNGTTNNSVYFGNDGGLFRADDVTTVGTPGPTDGWTKLDNGYSVTQFYYGAGNISSGQIVAGAQDNGSLSTTTTTADNWFSLYGGDGGACGASQDDPTIFYGEYVYLAVFRASNAANSGQYIDGSYWDGSSWRRKPPPYNLADSGSGNTALFIAPFLIDPNNQRRMLAGGISLWRTNSADAPITRAAGPIWETIKAPLASQARISAIAVAPSDSNIVLVGYENGRVDISEDATAASPKWTSALGAGTYCTSLTMDPQDPTVRYVTHGGYDGNTVFRYDANQHAWLNITPWNLKLPVHSIAVHPTRSDYLYIGSDGGLWVSEDGGTNWQPDKNVPTTCAIFNLFWMDKTLISVTHGRGVFTVDLSLTF